MNQRYSKVFALPENLYAQSAPVLIAAGQLLRDSATGGVVAQLKLMNLSDQTIIAAKVCLILQDIAGNPLGKTAEQYYMDFQAKQGEFFGEKTAVPVSNVNCRSFQATVTEVVFADRTVWQGVETPWEPLPRPEAFAAEDAELQKQYRLACGEKAAYRFREERGLWLCPCGRWNLGEVCPDCGNTVQKLRELTLQALEQAKADRLAEEARQAEEARRAIEEAARKAAEEAAAKAAKHAIMRKKRIKAGLIASLALAVSSAAAALFLLVLKPMWHYRAAEELLAEGKYPQAALEFGKAGDYRDAWERCRSVSNGSFISAGIAHTVALQVDGTVEAVGNNRDGQRNVFDWVDIVAVSAGGSHTVGLKGDGTVLAVGSNNYGQCGVNKWKNIISIGAGYGFTVGLRYDGTVVAVGDNSEGQCDTSSWTGTTAISAGAYHTVGLKEDGTVVTVGDNSRGQCDSSNWENILKISAGVYHTVGLLADGKVVACGYNLYKQCEVSDWVDIVAVSAGGRHTVGLRADGTVVAVGNNDYGQCNVSDWTDIVVISAGSNYTVGICSDGTMVAVGDNTYGQCNVSNWTDIRVPQ